MVYCEGHRREVGGGGGGEHILHFSIIFDDLMDDCSAYFYHFTLYNHERKIHHFRTECWITSTHTHTHTYKIHHIRTECWITSIIPISHCLTVANKYRVTKPAFLLCASKRKKQTLQLAC